MNHIEALQRTLQFGSYYSTALRHTQQFAYFMPENVSFGGERTYPLLVLLHGWGGGYRDWPTMTRLARYAAAYEICIAFPDGASGWYTNAYNGTADYEDDLMGCFIPHLQSTLPLHAPGKRWAIGGLSMGGYGAIKMVLRYPELFSLGMSSSGAFDIPRRPEPHSVFGAPETDSALRRSANLYCLVEDVLSRWPMVRPRLYFDCGVGDELLSGNRRFHEHLNFLGYHHTYLEMPGYHTWPYWDRAIRTALPEIAKSIGAT